jgi:hypothetical protein
MAPQALSSGKTAPVWYRTGAGGVSWTAPLIVRSLVALAVAGRLVPEGSADEPSADADGARGWGVTR